MKSTLISGAHFEVDRGGAKFFDVRGVKDEGAWLLRVNGNPTFSRVYPVSPVDAIVKGIRQIANSSKKDKLAIVQVSPQTGIKLYLCGKITVDDLAQASEDETGIDIPQITFGEYTLDVRISSELEYTLAFTDTDGVKL